MIYTVTVKMLVINTCVTYKTVINILLPVCSMLSPVFYLCLCIRSHCW